MLPERQFTTESSLVLFGCRLQCVFWVLNTYVSVCKMERVAICYDVSLKTVESPQYLFGSAPGFFSFC